MTENVCKIGLLCTLPMCLHAVVSHIFMWLSAPVDDIMYHDLRQSLLFIKSIALREGMKCLKFKRDDFFFPRGPHLIRTNQKLY